MNLSFCFLGPAHQSPVLASRVSFRHPAGIDVLITLAKWLLEFLGILRIFLGIPRDKGVNFPGKFGLGIPRNSQPKQLWF